MRQQEVGERLVDGGAVDEHLRAPDLDRLARQADDALDEVALGIFGELEDHDIAAHDRDASAAARARGRWRVGANTNLFTSRWSPTSRFGSIEPVGILKACTTNVRMNSARMTATTIDSKYSRTVDFSNASVGHG